MNNTEQRIAIAHPNHNKSMTIKSDSELPETPAEEKDLVGIATHALFGCPMSSEEAHSKIYGDYKAWEREWMRGHRDPTKHKYKGPSQSK